MEILKSRHKPRHQSGFTLVETMVAIVVLAAGMMGVAALMSQMSSSGHHSRYMSLAAVLANEKLEDLNKYPSDDPAVSSAGGSLAADTAGYFDTVQLSSGNGSIAETVQGTVAGNIAYTTITHLPDGTMNTVTTGAPPAPGPDTLTFDRRWIITTDQPVAGVRRVTVLVSLQSPLLNKAVTFQASLVRP
jgi:prepilin-type N-terminal cleavage/methylation domain-containing protein